MSSSNGSNVQTENWAGDPMLVPMKDILLHAQKEGYAVVAANCNNEDTVRACIEAAEEQRSAIILNIGYGANSMQYDHRLGRLVGEHFEEVPKLMVFFGRICEKLAEDASIPVAINLDHGASFEHAIWAIRAGYTSIMIDRSMLPFEQNIAEVKELVKIAHAVNVSVEAELGHVGWGAQYEKDGISHLTDPTEARQYVAQTGCDALAVAIGSAHGEYSGTPYIDFDRLKEIRNNVTVPLVLHGGSGTGKENLRRAAKEGICKVNIGTDLYKAGAKAWNDANCTFAGNGYQMIKEGYKRCLISYMEILGSCNRY